MSQDNEAIREELNYS